MLRRTDVQGDTAHITLMYRSYHLRHHWITHLLGKGRQGLLVIAHHLRHHRNTGTLQQLMHNIRRHITIFLNIADDIPDTGHIHAKEFDLRCGRRRCADNAGKCGGQRHFVREIDMTFFQKFCHFGTSRMHAGQDGEDRFMTFLNFLVKHIIGRIELYQSGRAKDNEDSIYLREPLIAVVNGNAQLFRCSCGQNVYRITHGSTGKELVLQFLCGRTFQLRHLQSSF